ncbi:hypothetical protein LTS12_028124, partial [Elasticomyces elasticus]
MEKSSSSSATTPVKRSSYDAGFDSSPRETRRASMVVDGRPPAPRISKARACAECKRHKIRCEIKSGQSSCAKCTRSGIKCVMNDFSQKFVDDDGIWKSQAASSLQQLQAAVSHILRYNKLPELSTYLAGDGLTASPVASSDSRHASHYENDNDDDINGSGNGRPGPGMDVTREPSQEPDLQDPELVPAPMRSLYEVTKLRNFRNNFVGKPKVTMLEEDFISRGLISLQEAEELFAYFSRTMNQLLWGGIIL